MSSKEPCPLLTAYARSVRRHIHFIPFLDDKSDETLKLCEERVKTAGSYSSIQILRAFYIFEMILRRAFTADSQKEFEEIKKVYSRSREGLTEVIRKLEVIHMNATADHMEYSLIKEAKKGTFHDANLQKFAALEFNTLLCLKCAVRLRMALRRGNTKYLPYISRQLTVFVGRPMFGVASRASAAVAVLVILLQISEDFAPIYWEDENEEKDEDPDRHIRATQEWDG